MGGAIQRGDGVLEPSWGSLGDHPRPLGQSPQAKGRGMPSSHVSVVCKHLLCTADCAC